ncbi:MAG: PKD domain-containing protein, partial [Thermoplasmata archaeon]|nr:PKD domain-containing protein [Thermoplasmata archaeon]
GAAISGGMPPDTLSWTVGGVPISSATNGSHVFPLMGNFVLQLSVRDTGGNTALRTFHIAVGATPPPPLSVVVAGGPLVGEAPFNATFTVIANGGQGPYSPIWSFGDGSEASGSVSTHTFVAPGTYQVQVSVTDAVADFATALLNVTALPSLTTAVTASVQSGTAPLAVTFTATPTGGNGTAVVRWDFGNGGGASGATAQTTYTTAGTYTATAVVTDSLGGYALATATISVAPIVHTHPPAINNSTPVVPAATGISPPEAGAIGAGVVGAIAVVAGVVLWRRRPGG